MGHPPFMGPHRGRNGPHHEGPHHGPHHRGPRHGGPFGGFIVPEEMRFENKEICEV